MVEVYSALQTRIVDGQENPLALIETAKFYEVQKYCSLTSHMWEGFWMVANRRSWERLPADLETAVMKLLDKSLTERTPSAEQLLKDLGYRGDSTKVTQAPARPTAKRQEPVRPRLEQPITKTADPRGSDVGEHAV